MSLRIILKEVKLHSQFHLNRLLWLVIVFLVFIHLPVIAAANGGIVFSWDDEENTSQWYKADEMFREYGANQTFYIGSGAANDTVCVRRLREMAEEGHEIGCHTVNHVNVITYVDSFGIQAYIDNEIIRFNNVLDSIGLPIPKNFAYPFGARYSAIDTALFAYFETVRGLVSVQALLPQPSAYYYVLGSKTRFVNGAAIVHGTLTPDEIIAGLAYAKQNNQVVFLYGHGIKEGWTPYQSQTSGIYEINIGYLRKICDYVLENDMKFYTATELYNYPDTLRPFIKTIIPYNSGQIRLVFNEALEKASVEDASHYQLTGSVSVDSARLIKNRREVVLFVSGMTDGQDYSLSVAGLTDKADTPNAMEAVVRSFTFSDTLIIRNTKNRSSFSYSWDTLALGKGLYVDDAPSVFNTIPSQYLGLPYLKTNEASLGTPNDSFVSFEVNKEVVVYVGRPIRAQDTLPQWLKSFTNTGDKFARGSTLFTIFAKTFPQGVVTLGSNEGAGWHTNYVIAVKSTNDPTGVQSPQENLLNFTNENIQVFPNPFNGKVTIKIPDRLLGSEIKVLDPAGRVVANLTRAISGGSRYASWDASGFVSGIYVVELKNGNRKLKQRTLLIR